MTYVIDGHARNLGSHPSKSLERLRVGRIRPRAGRWTTPADVSADPGVQRTQAAIACLQIARTACVNRWLPPARAGDRPNQRHGDTVRARWSIPAARATHARRCDDDL